MKKKKNKNKEELKNYLKELSNKDSLTNEDADRLTNMIDELVFGTKAERFVALMASFILKLIILYVVSLIASAFFLSEFLLDRYYIFLISLGIAFLLSVSESISSMFVKKGLYTYIISLFGIVVVTFIFNSIVPTFRFDSIWIIYLICIEIIYNLLMITIFKRKFKM